MLYFSFYFLLPHGFLLPRGRGGVFLVFILPEHNSAMNVAVAYSSSLYFVKSRQLSQIIDPIARFRNSIWAFTFFFMVILFKGSLSFIFVSYITPLFSILCLMLSFSSFHNFCSKIHHHSDQLWDLYRPS